MTQKFNFKQMSRSELRTYVLAHRDDEEALRIYIERLHNEQGVIQQTGGLDEEDFEQLEQLLSRQVKDN
jgi:hypothetical protein